MLWNLNITYFKQGHCQDFAFDSPVMEIDEQLKNCCVAPNQHVCVNLSFQAGRVFTKCNSINSSQLLCTNMNTLRAPPHYHGCFDIFVLYCLQELTKWSFTLCRLPCCWTCHACWKWTQNVKQQFSSPCTCTVQSFFFMTRILYHVG